MSRSSGPFAEISAMRPAAGGDDFTQCSLNDEQDSIKQLAEIAKSANRMEGVYCSQILIAVDIIFLVARIISIMLVPVCQIVKAGFVL